jgi:pyruvate formate lyase activating enzyme
VKDTAGAPSRTERSRSASTAGLVFNIQRFCIHDGPGIRTTVFLKGCPLNCLWCHNPESQSPYPELLFYSDRCTGCARCIRVCTGSAVSMQNAPPVHLNRELCRTCGACIEVCPAEARAVSGRWMTAEEVMAVAERDRRYYNASGGGITISGGEPTLQLDFTEAVLKLAKSAGLHTCVDTCGFARWNAFERLLPLTDLFLYDLKAVSPELHLSATGVDNRPILDNARRLAASGAEVLFRVPVIPGINDSPEELQAIAAFLSGLGDKFQVEVMPFHRLGLNKYRALGRNYPLENTQPSEQSTETAKQVLSAAGIKLV